MIEKIINDPNLFNDYLDFFIERFVYSNLEIEGYTTDEARRIESNLIKEAFITMLNKENKLDYYDLGEVGSKVNESSGIEGYRKINVLSGADFDPVPPEHVRMAIYYLFDNYHNMWDLLDIFEREARLCIELMRIHPFEDGNKRITKVILNTNLLRQKVAPVMLTEEDNALFYRYITQQDYTGFAAFLKQRSAIEKNTMVGFLKSINQNKNRS